MKRIFADTHFYIALLNRDDPAHAKVRSFLAEQNVETVVTTSWVVAETANAFSKSRRRADCGRLLAQLSSNAGTKLVPLSEALQRRGLKLFIERADKEWSLTDCISFIVMGDEGLTDALTGDRHFEQAGFTALLA